jgi:hypothetical protein
VGKKADKRSRSSKGAGPPSLARGHGSMSTAGPIGVHAHTASSQDGPRVGHVGPLEEEISRLGGHGR